ncbi:DgyrCDS10738 [Dimorphilus gyrociliatus]|uniref:DgyrCDS10738 n=1 Tax=Dimorphilus gyrociliatus TaxID=2664684 RepID=A0A7I8W2B3_9ANNE|nr:DgyrCDS10738 [Dimorphilus gyrociliatus]
MEGKISYLVLYLNYLAKGNNGNYYEYGYDNPTRELTNPSIGLERIKVYENIVSVAPMVYAFLDNVYNLDDMSQKGFIITLDYSKDIIENIYASSFLCGQDKDFDEFNAVMLTCNGGDYINEYISTIACAEWKTCKFTYNNDGFLDEYIADSTDSLHQYNRLYLRFNKTSYVVCHRERTLYVDCRNYYRMKLGEYVGKFANKFIYWENIRKGIFSKNSSQTTCYPVFCSKNKEDDFTALSLHSGGSIADPGTEVFGLLKSYEDGKSFIPVYTTKATPQQLEAYSHLVCLYFNRTITSISRNQFHEGLRHIFRNFVSSAFNHSSTVLLINCRTNAQQLSDCNFKTERAFLIFSNDVRVLINKCGEKLTPLPDYQFRLENVDLWVNQQYIRYTPNNSSYFGRLQVSFRNDWFYVSNWRFGQAESRLICKEFGYNFSQLFDPAYVEYHPRKVLLSLDCKSSQTLKDCRMDNTGMHLYNIPTSHVIMECLKNTKTDCPTIFNNRTKVHLYRVFQECFYHIHPAKKVSWKEVKEECDSLGLDLLGVGARFHNIHFLFSIFPRLLDIAVGKLEKVGPNFSLVMNGRERVCDELTMFTCLDEPSCIHINYKCDGFQDCLNGADELNCSESRLFQCDDNTLISYLLVCDAIKDCSNGLDENLCENGREEERVVVGGGGRESELFIRYE